MKTWIVAALIVLGGVFCFMKFKPAEVIETKTSESKIFARQDKNVVTRTKITTKKLAPEGSVIEEKVEETEIADKSIETSAEQFKTSEVRIEKSRSDFAVEGRIGSTFSMSPKIDSYGIEVQKRILGPVWLGLGYENLRGEHRVTTSIRMEF